MLIWPDWASLSSSVETRCLASVEVFTRPLMSVVCGSGRNVQQLMKSVWMSAEMSSKSSCILSVCLSFLHLSSQERDASWGTGTDMKESTIVTLCSLSPSGPEQPPVAAAGLSTTECVCQTMWLRSPAGPGWCYLQGHHGARGWSGTWADDCRQGGVQGTCHNDGDGITTTL